MKFLLITFALIGIATAAILPDSATQGPNPQDIATPEPEYIDIDLPDSAPAPAPAPAPSPAHAPQAASIFSSQYKPIQTAYSSPFTPQYQSPQSNQILPGHYKSSSGYHYRRPVYVRRIYRRRF